MKTNDEESNAAQSVRVQNFCRTVTVWKELNLLNKFLQHVTTHACLCTWGTEKFPFTEVSWLYQVCSPHTKAKHACCTETLVISQVSVRNYCCYLTSIFVSLLGSHLLLRMPFCLKKLKHLHFGLISQDFQGVFFLPLFLLEPAIWVRGQ